MVVPTSMTANLYSSIVVINISGLASAFGLHVFSPALQLFTFSLHLRTAEWDYRTIHKLTYHVKIHRAEARLWGV